jgi:hypothetical protein
MKRSPGVSRLILIILFIFLIMLAVNAAVMSIFFHINVFDLRYAKDAVFGRDGYIADQRLLSGEAGGNRDVSGRSRQDCCDSAGRDYGDKTGQDGSGYYIHPEEIESLKNLSLQDKLAVLSIISKIDRDVADRVYEMSKDGVTYHEFAEIKESVENYLEPADVEILEELFHRSREIYAGKQ